MRLPETLPVLQEKLEALQQKEKQLLKDHPAPIFFKKYEGAFIVGCWVLMEIIVAIYLLVTKQPKFWGPLLGWGYVGAWIIGYTGLIIWTFLADWILTSKKYKYNNYEPIQHEFAKVRRELRNYQKKIKNWKASDSQQELLQRVEQMSVTDTIQPTAKKHITPCKRIFKTFEPIFTSKRKRANRIVAPAAVEDNAGSDAETKTFSFPVEVINKENTTIEKNANGKIISKEINNGEPFTKSNYIKLHALRTEIGEMGEQFIVEWLQYKATIVGKLVEPPRIEWVSKINDALGYDIITTNNEGRKRYIEVKTTTLGKDAPFYLSPKELRCARELPNYWIYRLYNFDIAAKKGLLYMIDCSRPWEDHYLVQPGQYIITPK